MVMKHVVLALALLAATSAFADDDAEKLKAFRDLNPDRPATGHAVQWHLGYVEFRALGMDWRIFYLPILPPVPGSGFQNTAKIPNAFDLTQTPYASTLPPMFDHDRSRAVEREYQRIEKLTKKQKIEVKKE
jgi:hypothetical protein